MSSNQTVVVPYPATTGDSPVWNGSSWDSTSATASLDYTGIAMSDADYTVSVDEASKYILRVTGALTDYRNFILPSTPAAPKIIQNFTTGSWGTLFVKRSGQTGSVAVKPGQSVFVYSDGADIKGFQASGPVINVLDFGADPTGVTECSTALQAAIDAGSRAYGATVFFPDGVYKISTGLVLANVHLKGVHRDATVRSTIRAAQGATIDKMLYSAAGVCHLTDLKVDCSYDDNVTHRVANYGWYGTSYCIFDNILVFYAVLDGFYMNDCEGSTVRYCQSIGCRRNQWSIYDCNFAHFESIAGTSASDTLSTGWAMDIQALVHSGGCVVDSVDLEGTGGGALRIKNTTTPVSIRNLWTELDGGTVTRANAQDGCLIEGAGHVSLYDCYFSTNGNSDTPGASTNRVVRVKNATNCSIFNSRTTATIDASTVNQIRFEGTTSGTNIRDARKLTGVTVEITPVDDQTAGLRQNVQQLMVSETSTIAPAGTDWLAGELIKHTGFRSDSRPVGYLRDNRSFWQSHRPLQIQSPFIDLVDLVDAWDTLSGVTQSGGAVSAWAGARGTSLVQATAANKPAYSTGGWNNLPKIAFDGTDDLLTTTISSSLTDFTLYFAVVPQRITPSNQTCLAAFGSFAPEFYINGGFWDVYEGADLPFNDLATAVVAQPYVLCFWRSGTSFYGAAYTSTSGAGVSGGVSFQTSALGATATGTAFQLCSATVAGSDFGKYDYYYTSLHSTAHSDGTRILVKNFLLSRMGL